jgi:zona occludens toxin
MIICHEGLPGSGKSYEAAINQIIPALKNGRKVFAYIEGLNHQKFADILEVPIDVIQSLLIQINKQQVHKIYDHVENDSLVVIDELQDFFPHAGKKQLDQGITEFVTQHRHRGIDIVVMGQSHKDFHVLWKRRIDLLITFMKRDALGMPNAYTWKTFKQQGEKFVKIQAGGGKYDSKYFGLYASHNAGVSSIDVYSDDRANIFKSSAFRLYLPIFVVLLCVAIYYLYGVFFGDKLVSSVKSSQPAKSSFQSSPQSPIVQSAPAAPAVPVVPATPKPTEPPVLTREQLNSYDGFLDNFFKTYRPRLSAVVVRKSSLLQKGKENIIAKVEFYDDKANKLQDAFDLHQISELGYTFRFTSLGLIVKGHGHEYVVKAWHKEEPDSRHRSTGYRDIHKNVKADNGERYDD